MKLESTHSNSFLTINQKTYFGSIKPENVFEAICGAYLSSPDSCLFLNNKYSVFIHYQEYKRKVKKYKFWVYFFNIFALIMLLTLSGIAIYLLYNKIYSRFLAQNVATIVRESMSNYHSLKDNV